MKELVYLDDRDYIRILLALYRYRATFETYGSDEMDQIVRDDIMKTIAKIERAKGERAKGEGLFLSFDVKKVKVRMVR